MPSSTANPTVSIIIVSWNACRLLEECLESLRERVIVPHEIIVVDNASADGSAEMVEARFPAVRLMRAGSNLGFARANNLGIHQSRGRYIALINSDVRVLPGCVDQLVEFLDSHPDAGMVGPKVVYPDLSKQNTCRHFPSVWRTFCEVFYLYRLFPRSPWFSGEQMWYFDNDRQMEVEVLSGCFLVVRKTAVEDFGLLDEDFFFYCEDIDWSIRRNQAGWKAYFAPGSRAIHHGGGSAANDSDRFTVAHYLTRLQLWRKHQPAGAQVCHRLLISFQSTLRLAVHGCLALTPRKRHQSLSYARNLARSLRAIWKQA
jgi:GT2 family glycosyltransferase